MNAMPRDNTTVQQPPAVPRPTFLRIGAVVRETGLGRSTIYRLIAGEMFPGPVQLGPRAVGWRRSDLEQWSSTRRATRDWTNAAR